MVLSFVVHAGLPDLNRAQACLNLPCGQMAIANDQTMTLFIELISMLAQEVADFSQ